MAMTTYGEPARCDQADAPKRDIGMVIVQAGHIEEIAARLFRAIAELGKLLQPILREAETPPERDDSVDITSPLSNRLNGVCRGLLDFEKMVKSLIDRVDL